MIHQETGVSVCLLLAKPLPFFSLFFFSPPPPPPFFFFLKKFDSGARRWELFLGTTPPRCPCSLSRIIGHRDAPRRQLRDRRSSRQSAILPAISYYSLNCRPASASSAPGRDTPGRASHRAKSKLLISEEIHFGLSSKASSTRRNPPDATTFITRRVTENRCLLPYRRRPRRCRRRAPRRGSPDVRTAPQSDRYIVDASADPS